MTLAEIIQLTRHHIDEMDEGSELDSDAAVFDLTQAVQQAYMAYVQRVRSLRMRVTGVGAVVGESVTIAGSSHTWTGVLAYPPHTALSVTSGATEYTIITSGVPATGEVLVETSGLITFYDDIHVAGATVTYVPQSYPFSLFGSNGEGALWYEISHVEWNGVPLGVASMADLDLLDNRWRSRAAGTPFCFYMPQEEELGLHYAPSDATTSLMVEGWRLPDVQGDFAKKLLYGIRESEELTEVTHIPRMPVADHELLADYAALYHTARISDNTSAMRETKYGRRWLDRTQRATRRVNDPARMAVYGLNAGISGASGGRSRLLTTSSVIP